MGTFEEILCPICGQWRTSRYWHRIASGVRPSSVARLREGLGYRYGFKTVKSFENYRFFYPDFVIIRNQIFDTLRLWLEKGFISPLELKMAFIDLFREERVKEAFIRESKPLLLVWRKISPYREGSTKDVIL